MTKPKAADSAKESPEDAWASLRTLAETPARPPGRELTIDELRQRAAECRGDEAKFYAQLVAIMEGKVMVRQPSKDPLPNWTMQGNGYGSMRLQSVGYTCDDPAEQEFALGVMRMTGFSIPDFDVWLDSIGFCGARTELMIRRGWMAEALQASNEDGVRRHLEWMVNRRREIQDKLALVPLAQHGAVHKAASSRGGKASGEQRSEDAAADHAEWVQRGSELLRQGKAPRELAAILAIRFRVSSKQMRSVLREAGLVKKREAN